MGIKERKGGEDTIYFYFIFNQQQAQKMRGRFPTGSDANCPWVWGESRPLHGRARTEVFFRLRKAEGLLLNLPPNKERNKAARRENEPFSFRLIYANKTEENCLKHRSNISRLSHFFSKFSQENLSQRPPSI